MAFPDGCTVSRFAGHLNVLCMLTLPPWLMRAIQRYCLCSGCQEWLQRCRRGPAYIACWSALQNLTAVTSSGNVIDDMMTEVHVPTPSAETNNIGWGSLLRKYRLLGDHQHLCLNLIPRWIKWCCFIFCVTIHGIVPVWYELCAGKGQSANVKIMLIFCCSLPCG